MRQVPPPFAVACPSDYDARLPALTPQHVARLRQAVPELAHHLQGQQPALPQPSAALPTLARQVADELAAFGQQLASGGARLIQLTVAVARSETEKASQLQRQIKVGDAAPFVFCICPQALLFELLSILY